MNIQDIRNVLTIAECGSISKAAEQLLVAQPALSKCIKKVEGEYGVTLFTRTRGSSASLTREGEAFVTMARQILSAHDGFEEELKGLRERDRGSFRFGIQSQRAHSFVEPFLEELQRQAPDLIANIQIESSAQMRRELCTGAPHMAILGEVEGHFHRDLHYEKLFSSRMGLFLRTGSPAAAKAVVMKGFDYPVLRLEDLADETFVVNLPGSATRAYQDMVSEKAGVPLHILELPDFYNRVNMVKTGRANLFYALPSYSYDGRFEAELADQTYFLHPDQNIAIHTCLVCRPSFRSDRRFQAATRCARKTYQHVIEKA